MCDMFTDPRIDKESETAKSSTSLTSEAASSADPLPQGKQFKKQLIFYAGSDMRNTRCEGKNI